MGWAVAREVTGAAENMDEYVLCGNLPIQVIRSCPWKTVSLN